MPSPRAEGAETARRALRLLELISQAPEPLLLGELIRRTELNKSTVYRLLRVLQDEKYVEHVDGGGYRSGSRLVALAAAALPDFDTYDRYLPTLRRLSDESGETASLHRRVGDQAVLLLGAENPRSPLRRVLTAGELTPVTRGSAGLAILANLDPDVADELIEMQSADDVERIRRDLAKGKTAGYMLSFGMNHPGLHGVAVPVPGTEMSVAVSGPASRFTEDRMILFAPQLVEAIREFGDRAGLDGRHVSH